MQTHPPASAEPGVSPRVGSHWLARGGPEATPTRGFLPDIIPQHGGSGRKSSASPSGAATLCPLPAPLHSARDATPRMQERLRGRRLTSRPATRRSARHCAWVCAVPTGAHLQAFIVCCSTTSHADHTTQSVRRTALSNVVCFRPTLAHGRSACCWLLLLTNHLALGAWE